MDLLWRAALAGHLPGPDLPVRIDRAIRLLLNGLLEPACILLAGTYAGLRLARVHLPGGTRRAGWVAGNGAGRFGGPPAALPWIAAAVLLPLGAALAWTAAALASTGGPPPPGHGVARLLACTALVVATATVLESLRLRAGGRVRAAAWEDLPGRAFGVFRRLAPYLWVSGLAGVVLGTRLLPRLPGTETGRAVAHSWAGISTAARLVEGTLLQMLESLGAILAALPTALQ